MQGEWSDKIFRINKPDFEALCLEIFRFQYRENYIYHDFVSALAINPAAVRSVTEIPFLPISFFKTHTIQTTAYTPAAVFESSGTTGSVNSRNCVKDLLLYEESFLQGFKKFYGHTTDYCIIGLLPSYLERGNASLVYMVDKLIWQSEHPLSGFYLHDHNKLATVLKELEKQKQKTLLIGVTFALLDFAEQFSFPLNYTIIMETGGMKGRRKEMVREEVHTILKRSFQVSEVHSEYGMTELLSQAWSNGNGIFNCPPWMQVLLRDEEDPLKVNESGSGLINVIDLANVYSCSFIATDDIGQLNMNGSFEVLGRIDGSDLRGCSLMVV